MRSMYAKLSIMERIGNKRNGQYKKHEYDYVKCSQILTQFCFIIKVNHTQNEVFI